jgi:hypothetical protein
MDTILEPEFTKVAKQFITELELSFDYIPDDVKENLKNVSTSLQTSPTSYMDSFYETMKPFSDEMNRVCFANAKVKQHHLEFLKNVVVFDIVNMDMFSDENKNTKITLVKYLNSMYTTCHFRHCATQVAGKMGDEEQGDKNMEQLAEEMKKMMSTLIPSDEPLQGTSSKQKPNSRPRASSSRQRLPANLGSNGLLQSLFSNPQLLNMANEITSDLQTQNLNPMTLLSSIVSGKPDAQLNNMIANIAKKIEDKIETGELDKQALEAQALDVMSKVKTDDLAAELLKSLKK